MDETKTHQKIALFACNGDLPKLVENALQKQNIHSIIIAFEGITHPTGWDNKNLHWHKIGHVGGILKTLRDAGVTHVTFAGSLKRPNLQALSMDTTGMQWLGRLGMSIFKGDDGLLSAVLNLIEREGFQIVAPHTWLEDIMASVGGLTALQPSKEDIQDIQKGWDLLRVMSPFDVGQAVVVRKGVILGIEALEGTQGLLERVALMKEGMHSGVLVKGAKIGQSLKIDVPTIGPDTVEQVKNAGLRGMAMSAHTTQILMKEKVIALCNQRGLFLDVFKDERS